MGWCQLSTVCESEFPGLQPRGTFNLTFRSLGAKGSENAKYEKATWPALRNLAQHSPESGVHFQGNLGAPIEWESRCYGPN